MSDPKRKTELPRALVETAAKVARHREAGDFDGLLGRLPPIAQSVMGDLLRRNRDYLLDHYKHEPDCETAIRRLIEEHTKSSSNGLRGVTPIPDSGARLAIHALGDIANTLIPGIDGAARLWTIVTARDASVSAKRARGSVAGGNARANKANAEWRDKARIEALRLLKSGTPRRNIAGILAPRYDKDPKTIRTAIADVLKKRGEA